MAQRKWALQLHFSKRPERGLTADIIWNVYEASKDCPGTKWQVLSSHETVSREVPREPTAEGREPVRAGCVLQSSLGSCGTGPAVLACLL